MSRAQPEQSVVVLAALGEAREGMDMVTTRSLVSGRGQHQGDHHPERSAALFGIRSAPDMPAVDRSAVASTLSRLKIARPRVHAMVAPVAQPICANVAAALGIDISMTIDADEVRPMADSSGALLINLGMLDPARRAGALSMVASGRPFVLDPVKVDRVPARLKFARELLAHGPLVVKGNPAEMAALGPIPAGCLAVTTSAVDRLAVSGADGDRLVYLANGTSMMARVIATGCTAGVLIAAMCAIEADPLLAAIAAISLFNVSAETAAVGSAGPGTFAIHLIDALGAADPYDIASRLRSAEAPLDPTLYVVMGPDVADPVRLAREAAAGGATLIQWRDKDGATSEQVAAVRALVAASPVPVVVNDRADVALAAGAAGVHIGHGDLDPAAARAIVGPSAIVGLTVHTLDEAAAADGTSIDYASVGGVFATGSKHNPHPPIGIEGFQRIAARLRRARSGLPVVAIAGIDAERARALGAAGADGVAVMSAVTRAALPREAAAAVKAAFREGRS
ncbi:thiamine phosphate synthase [Acuticoccus sp.]|uniref:thiamine phosphate synthase n=1 Tax=Acuticoccus sp. TaxID=1904378 RepID=UPI003B521308